MCVTQTIILSGLKTRIVVLRKSDCGQLVRSAVQYLTFGQPSRLLDITIGSFVLGSASDIGSLPSGVSGLVGYAVAVFAVTLAAFIGIKIGQKTLSLRLNQWPFAVLIALLHLLYVGGVLCCIQLLRGGIEIQTVLSSAGQVAALVSILTLGYLATVYRTTSPAQEKRQFIQDVYELADEMDRCWDEDDVDRQDMKSIKKDANELSDRDLTWDFADVEQLEDAIDDVCDALDQDTRGTEIVTGSYSKKSQSGTLTEKFNKYKDAKAVLEQCKT